MSRLRQVKPKELISALKRAGFVEVGQIGSHRIMVNEKQDIQTSVPVHPGDVARGLLKKILKQAGLSEDEFKNFL